jgi:hypothetical protein
MQFIEDLDPAATLAAAESVVSRRRTLDIEELLLALRWADLHGSDPQLEPGAVPVVYGGDHLVDVGGEGTPHLQDLCAEELGIALHVHTLSARHLLADALDLRHRLPRTFTVFLEQGCPGWLARKVATMTRQLSLEAVAVVDAAVAAAIATESPGRVLRIVEAKIVEADAEAHAAELERKRRAKHVSLTRSDEHGLRYLIAHLEAGDAAVIDAVVDRLADLLRDRRDLVPDLPADCSKDELRAAALGWLARPEDALALLNAEQPPRATRRDAVVYVHLHQSAVDGTATGVARVEGLGPMLLQQLRELLGHDNVSLAPVIDLNDQVSVNSYEHPESVKERTHLRTTGEVFPYAVSQSRRTDTDHPAPYVPHGPPGQTGDHNAGRLHRHHHRAKTHKGYRVTQIGPAEYLWRTPHGLCRLVNVYGTHDLTETDAWLLEHPHAGDELDRIAERIRAQRAS